MRFLTFCFAFVLLCATACAPKPAPPSASSETGSVPTGTWSGEYGPSSDRRDSITVDLHWENTDLRGVVHAGARSLPLTKASYQSDTGAISMEFDAQGNGAQIVHYVIKGKVSGDTMT